MKRFLSWIANKSLGSFAQAIAPDDINFAPRKGDFGVRRLRIKDGVLLPYEVFADVKEASLDDVSIKVPWKQLFGNGSVVVKAERLFIVLKSRESSKETHEQRAEKLKQTKLAALNLIAMLGMDKPDLTSINPPPPPTEPGFIMKKVWQVIDNVKIMIESVHVRFEDDVSSAMENSPTYFGVTLGSLTIESITPTGSPVQVEQYQPYNHRKISVRDLAVYADTKENAQLVSTNKENTTRELLSMISPEFPHEYLVHPLTVDIHFTMNREILTTDPKLALQLATKDISMALNAEQYQRLLNTITHLNTYLRKLWFLDQPNLERTPRGYWRYACQSVLAKIREKHQYWSWDNYLKCKAQRLQYVNLYRRKIYLGSVSYLFFPFLLCLVLNTILPLMQLSKEDNEKLKQLEEQIDYHQVLMYRKLAHASIAKAQADGNLRVLSFFDRLSKVQRAALLITGGLFLTLFLSVFVGFPVALSLVIALAGGAIYKFRQQIMKLLNDVPTITDLPAKSEIWKPFFTIVAAQEEIASSAPKKTLTPKEYVGTKVEVSVEQIRATLKRTPESEVTTTLPAVNCQVLMREGSMSVIGGFSAPQIGALIGGKSITILTDINPQSKMQLDSRSKVAAFEFHLQPIHKPGIDIFFGMHTPPIWISVAVPVVMEAVAFFTPKANIAEVKAVAKRGLTKVAEMARAQVKYAILQKKTIQLDVNVKAPVISVPRKAFLASTKGTSQIIIDLGTLRVSSNPKRPTKEIEHNLEALKDYIYDRYSITVSDMAALCVPKRKDIDSCMKSANLYLIQPFSMKADVDVCTMPAIEIPNIKISGGLVNDFAINVTPPKIARLLMIVNSVLKDLQNSPVYQEVPPPQQPATIVKKNPLEEEEYRRKLYEAKITESADNPTINLMKVDLVIPSLSLIIAQINGDELEANSMIPAAAIRFSNASLTMNQTSKFITMDVSLRKLSLSDCQMVDEARQQGDQNQAMLGRIITSAKNNDVIRIAIKNIPKTSPEYNSVANIVKATIGELIMHVSPPSLQRLLSAVNEVAAATKKAPAKKTKTPAETTPVEKVEVLPAKPETIIELSKEFLAQVSVEIMAVKLVLVRNGKPFVTTALTSSTAHLGIRGDGGLSISGALGELLMEHNSDRNEMWPKIIRVQSDKMITFGFNMYTIADTPDLDAAVQLKLASLQFVFLNLFLKELLDFTGSLTQALGSSNIQQSNNKSLESPTTTTNNKPFRLSLDVFVGSPSVLVPHSCSSSSHLLVELGDIKVVNAIQKTPENILLDVMEVDVSGLNVQSVKVVDDSPDYSFDIIQKTGVSVKLERVIYFEKRLLPDIDIAVELKPISLQVNQEEIDNLISVLVGNLREIPADLTERSPVASSITASTSEEMPATPSIGSAPAPAPPKDTSPETYIAQKINVKMPVLSFTLLSQQQPMLCFSSAGLTCDLQINSDSSMKVALEMDQLDLRDPRAAPDTFSYLLAKIAKEKLLSVQYITTPSMTTNITVRWSTPTVIVLPDTILALKDNFEKPVMSSLQRMSEGKGAESANRRLEQSPQSAVVPSAEPQSTESQSTLHVDLNLLSPRFILLKSRASQKTKALILSLGDIKVKYNMDAKKQTIFAKMQDFKFYKSKIQSNLVQSHVVDILQPFGCDIEMIMTSKSQNLSVISSVPMATIISYKDLQLIHQIHETFKPLLQSFSTDKTAQTSVSELSESSDSLTQSTSDTLNNEPQKPSVPFEFCVNLHSINFGLLDDRFTHGYFVPLMKMFISPIVVNGTIATSKTSVAFETNTIEALAYNRNLVGWEPILEPWRFSFQYESVPDNTKISLASPENSMLNINVTRTLLQSVLDMLDVLSQQTAKPSDGGASKAHANKAVSTHSAKSSQRYPFVLRNETGVTLKYWMGSDTEAKDIKSGTMVPLVVRSESRLKAIEQLQDYELNFSIDEPSYNHLQQKLSINKTGVKITKVARGNDTLNMVTEVSILPNGTKEITVRGEYVIRNEMDMPIIINMNGTEAKLEPKDTYCSALGMSGKDNHLFVRPEGFDWSKKIDLNKLDADPVTCTAADNKVWMCVAKQTGEARGINRSIVLTTPIIVENLLSVPLQCRLYDTSSGNTVLLENELAHTAEMPVYTLRSLDSSLLLSIKLAGYEWSKPVSFIDKYKHITSVSDSMDGVQTTTLELPDVKGRMLKLCADLLLISKKSAMKLVIYSRYWIANNTGLRLLFKHSPTSKLISAGQKWEETDVTSLPADQRQWYPTSLLRRGVDNFISASSSSTSSIAAVQPTASAAATALTVPSSHEDEKSSKRRSSKRKRTAAHEKLVEENYVYFGEKTLSIAVEDSIFSKEIKLGASNTGCISIKDPTTGRRYVFTLTVSPAPSKFWRTAIVRIFPTYIITNKTTRTILWKQDGVDDALEPQNIQRIEPGEQIPLHWPKTKPQLLQIKFADGSTSWSPSFSPADLGRFPVKLMRVDSENDFELIGLHIREKQNSSTFIVLHDDIQENYARIDNRTPFIIFASDPALQDMSEKSTQEKPDKNGKDSNKGKASAAASPTQAIEAELPGIKIPPHAKRGYVWDEPQTNDPMVSIYFEELKIHRNIHINKIKDLKPLHIPERQLYLHFRVRAKGRARVISISSSSDVAPPKEIAKEKNEKNKLTVSLQMQGVGLSLVDTLPQEVMYMSVQGIKLEYFQSSLQQSIAFSIQSIQLDNDLILTPYPVVLSSKPVPDKPVFQVALVRDMRYTHFYCFRYFAFSLQEIDVMVDQAFLLSILSWVAVVLDYMSSRSASNLEKLLLEASDENLPMLNEAELAVSNAFYFQVFHINPMKINLSYSPSVNFDLENLDVGATQLLLKLGRYLSRVEEAPVELNALLVENMFGSQAELTQYIVNHYVTSFLKQALKVLGSAEYLGNPVSAVRGMGTGVYSFFHEPAKAVVSNPAELGLSLVKGTGGLIKNTIGSVVGMAGTLIGNVAKLGEVASLDSEYKREREIMKQQKAHNVAEGVGYGLKEFGQGLFKGLSGVVLQPIKGAKKEGLKGFGKGLGKGLLGVVVKPTVGAVDLVTRTTEGIKNTGSKVEEKSRTRLPRHFGPDRLLTLYDPFKADGQYVLKVVDGGDFRSHNYVWHCMAGRECDKYLVVSDSHLFLIKKRLIADKLNMHESQLYTVEWKAKLTALSGEINTDPQDISVVLIKNSLPNKAAKPPLRVPCKNAEAMIALKNALVPIVKGAPSFVSPMKPSSDTKRKKRMVHSQSEASLPKINNIERSPSEKHLPTTEDADATEKEGGKVKRGVGRKMLDVVTFKQLRRNYSETDKEKSKKSPRKDAASAAAEPLVESTEPIQQQDEEKVETPSKKSRRKSGGVFRLHERKKSGDAASTGSEQMVVPSTPDGASKTTGTDQHRRHSRRLSSSDSIPTIATPTQFEGEVEVHKSGLLTKSQKKRYFVVELGYVRIYDSSEKRKLVNEFTAANCAVETTQPGRVALQAGSKKMTLVFRSPSEVESFVEALKSCQN